MGTSMIQCWLHLCDFSPLCVFKWLLKLTFDGYFYDPMASHIREAPIQLAAPLFGHCPNSNYTPPPHSNGHSGALFFRADLSKFAKSPF